MNETQGIERRTIVRGAAWTVPILAAAVAVPSAAASPGNLTLDLEAISVRLTSPASNSTIPASVGGGGQQSDYNYMAEYQGAWGGAAYVAGYPRTEATFTAVYRNWGPADLPVGATVHLMLYSKDAFPSALNSTPVAQFIPSPGPASTYPTTPGAPTSGSITLGAAVHSSPGNDNVYTSKVDTVIPAGAYFRVTYKVTPRNTFWRGSIRYATVAYAGIGLGTSGAIQGTPNRANTLTSGPLLPVPAGSANWSGWYAFN